MPRSENRAPKMLIADDDPCVVRALAERCTLMGFEVETAVNGLQALVKASECKPDVLVVDVHLPEVDGPSVCVHLLDINAKPPNVIVMTGHDNSEAAEWCRQSGAIFTRKGANFWRDFEAALLRMFPARAVHRKPTDAHGRKFEVKRRARVLVVDDDANVRRFLSNRLKALGVEPLCASDGTRGFWTAWHTEPTVIVSDYYMQNGDAEHLLLRLRVAPETRNIPFIVHSARRLDDSTRHRLRRDIHGQPGAARILRKSSGALELLEAIQRFCGFVTYPVVDVQQRVFSKGLAGALPR